jgi:hypothetical protein
MQSTHELLLISFCLLNRKLLDRFCPPLLQAGKPFLLPLRIGAAAAATFRLALQRTALEATLQCNTIVQTQPMITFQYTKRFVLSLSWQLTKPTDFNCFLLDTKGSIQLRVSSDGLVVIFGHAPPWIARALRRA